jgi:hypothetical protein
MGNKGCDVERADTNDADRWIIGREQKRAAGVVEKRSFRLNARRLHQRQSLVKNPPLGDRKDDWFSHNDRALRVAGGKGNMAENIGAYHLGSGLFCAQNV